LTFLSNITGEMVLR